MNVFGGWTPQIRLPDDVFLKTHVAVEYVTEGGDFAAFKEVLAELGKRELARQLTFIRLPNTRFMDDKLRHYDSRFQEEIFAELEKIAPAQLAKARNWREPHGAIPMESFKQAVLALPIVQEVNTELAPLGLCVSSVYFGEKFHFRRENNQLRFWGDLGLNIGKNDAPSSPVAALAQPSANSIVAAARSQVGKTLSYDPAYVRLAYPMGDIPIEKGVCTDVVVRALRDARKMDLQKLVHEDMTAAFSAYPNNWGLTKPDRNIDHRRVPNLQKYFERKGYSVAVTKKPEDYLPGDLVTSTVTGNRPHIMIVSDKKTPQGTPLVIHNIGRGAQEEDFLFNFHITGHYRIK